MLKADSPTIYHITTRGAWLEALGRGAYEAASLQTEGFIHASTRDQLLPTAQRVFAGRRGLLVLCIDPERLRADLRYEAADVAGADGPVLFPHVYGYVNLDAVVRVVELPVEDDGGFVLPEGLDG